MSSITLKDLPGGGPWKDLLGEAQIRGIQIIGGKFDANTLALVGLSHILAGLASDIRALQRDSHPPALLPIEAMQRDIRSLQDRVHP